MKKAVIWKRAILVDLLLRKIMWDVWISEWELFVWDLLLDVNFEEIAWTHTLDQTIGAFLWERLHIDSDCLLFGPIEAWKRAIWPNNISCDKTNNQDVSCVTYKMTYVLIQFYILLLCRQRYAPIGYI